MALTSLSEGRLFGERYGTSRTRVVALHGWGRDRRDFSGVLPGLDAVAVDLPGFGATPAPRSVIGATGYAELLAPWIESLGRPQVLIGHSFGGRLVAVLAAIRPELAAGAVLVGAPLLRPLTRAGKPPFGYRLIRWGNRVGLISDVRLEREKRRRGSDDYRMATGVMREVLVKVVNESYQEELGQLRCPVRLVWGADDQEVPVDVAYRSMELLEGRGLHDARLDVVSGCGHDVPRSAPARIRQVIEELL